MESWKQRLYAGYISTGQSGANIDRKTGLRAADYPQYSKLIRKHLPAKKDIAIADLACGHGTLLFCLRELGYLNLAGVDVSPEQVALAHELGLDEIKCQELGEFLADKQNHFDVIFLMDVLEHLSKAELFDCLDQVSRSLKTDGMIVIHVPNAEGIFGMRIRYGDLTHENCFTPQSIGQALRACGFHRIDCFEDKPAIHGLKSSIRYVFWSILTAPFRMLLAAETGATRHVLSQNMLVVASKKDPLLRPDHR